MIKNPLLDLILKWRQLRRFRQNLSSTLGQAQKWETPEAARTACLTALQTIFSRAIPARLKGEPGISGLKNQWARQLHGSLSSRQQPEALDLDLAARLASVNPGDMESYLAYLGLFWLVNRGTIASLKGVRSSYIALHMTCQPRLDRAQESIDSFGGPRGNTLLHIKLIGNAASYRFDSKEALLEVPADDSYEHLPSKVFAAYEILAIALAPRSVLKLDDDHRMQDRSALMARMAGNGNTVMPRQEGTLYRMDLPSSHHRAWHFGKCSDVTLNQTPISFPSPPAWLTGEDGYLLNASALGACAWANLSYSTWLRAIAYEDIAVGDVAERLGFWLIDKPLTRTCLSTKSAY